LDALARPTVSSSSESVSEAGCERANVMHWSDLQTTLETWWPWR
jgi:hypothetical protein